MNITFSEIFAFIVVTLLAASAFGVVFMLRIVEWLEAREDRKNAEAEAKAAEADPPAKPA